MAALVVNLAFTAFLPLVWISSDTHLLRFMVLVFLYGRTYVVSVVVLDDLVISFHLDAHGLAFTLIHKAEGC